MGPAFVNMNLDKKNKSSIPLQSYQDQVDARALSLRWDSRVVSCLHALVSCVGGVTVHFLFDQGAWTDPYIATFGVAHLRCCFLMATAGYLLFDLFVCFAHRKELQEEALTYVHHVLIVAAFSFGVYTHIGTYFMGSFLINEASTFSLNVNFFLAVHASTKRTVWYLVNGVLLLVSFVIFRIINNFISLAHIFGYCYRYQHQILFGEDRIESGYILVVLLLTSLAVGHVLINLIWFKSIALAVHRKLFKRTD
jgi:hypothetical protein